jgi:hypothetical protein
MATIKSYTDISQSKTLSKILPIESADMWWNFYSVTTDNTTPQIIHIDTPWVGSFNWNNKPDNIPCWSLASLLSVLPDYTLQTNTDGTVFVVCDSKKPMISDAYDNPVDACVEMILKLHELKML